MLLGLYLWKTKQNTNKHQQNQTKKTKKKKSKTGNYLWTDCVLEKIAAAQYW